MAKSKQNPPTAEEFIAQCATNAKMGKIEGLPEKLRADVERLIDLREQKTPGITYQAIADFIALHGVSVSEKTVANYTRATRGANHGRKK